MSKTSSPTTLQDLKTSHLEILNRMRSRRSTALPVATTTPTPVPESASILDENFQLTDMAGYGALDQLRSVIRSSAEASVFRSHGKQE